MTENEARHDLTMQVQDEPRMFRAVCSCGYIGPWKSTNAAMGSGHRHRAQMRRRAAAIPPDLCPTCRETLPCLTCGAGL